VGAVLAQPSHEARWVLLHASILALLRESVTWLHDYISGKA
jgi:hypothetical protein